VFKNEVVIFVHLFVNNFFDNFVFFYFGWSKSI